VPKPGNPRRPSSHYAGHGTRSRAQLTWKASGAGFGPLPPGRDHPRRRHGFPAAPARGGGALSQRQHTELLVLLRDTKGHRDRQVLTAGPVTSGAPSIVLPIGSRWAGNPASLQSDQHSSVLGVFKPSASIQAESPGGRLSSADVPLSPEQLPSLSCTHKAGRSHQAACSGSVSEPEPARGRTGTRLGGACRHSFQFPVPDPLGMAPHHTGSLGQMNEETMRNRCCRKPAFPKPPRAGAERPHLSLEAYEALVARGGG